MTSVADPTTLPRPLVDAVLARLGIARPVRTDLAAVRTVYAAWCDSVPFENVRKMIALGTGAVGPLPGGDPAEFFAGWLADAASGTCWATSGALHALLVALGFDARRVIGSIRDRDVLNHGTVVVRVDGADWVTDTSLMTCAPLPLGDGVHLHRHPLTPAEVERDARGHVLWFDVPTHAEPIPCRLLVDPAPPELCAARVEVSRTESVFNDALFARRGRPGRVVILRGATRHEITRDGVRRDDLAPDALTQALVDDIGIAPALVSTWVAAGGLASTYAPREPMPPPPPPRLPPSRRAPG